MVMPESPSSLHARLATEFRRRIASGGWPEGSQVPSEAQLVAEFGASRGSVRQALAALRAEGSIVGGQRRQPVVRRLVRSQPFTTFQSFSAWASTSGFTPGQRTIEVARRASDDEVAERLGLTPGDPVVQVLRLRLLDDLPAMVERTSFVLEVGRHLFDFDTDSGSVFSHLRDVGVDLHHARHTFDAVAADHIDAELMDIQLGFPLLRERRLTSTSRDEPVEVSDDRYLPSVSNIVIDNVMDQRAPLQRVHTREDIA